MPHSTVHRSRYGGRALCESIAPQLFEIDDDGVVEIAEERLDACAQAKPAQAIRWCPTRALGLSA